MAVRAFSVVAAVLAALGVFGALSYAIAQMKREIGIRVALGAPPTDVLRMLSAKPMMFAGLGVAAGVVAFIFLAPTFGGGLNAQPVPLRNRITGASGERTGR